MAVIAILTPEELAQREQKPQRQGRTGRRRTPERTRIIEAYTAAMREAEPGYGADVTLAPDEAKRQVSQKLKAAAQELNIALDFRRIKDRSRMHFQFITAEERAAKAKRGGRPPKQRITESAASDGGSEAAQTPGPSEAAGGEVKPATPRTRRTRTPAPAS
jgi:hypothetical protein